MLEMILTKVFTALFRAASSAYEQASQPKTPLPKDFPRADEAKKEAQDRLSKTKT